MTEINEHLIQPYHDTTVAIIERLEGLPQKEILNGALLGALFEVCRISIICGYDRDTVITGLERVWDQIVMT